MNLIRLQCIAAAALIAALPRLAAADFNVKSFGATGDGHTIDSPAINRAIEAAAAAGGGTVILPAGGTYASYSIHLRSHVDIVIEAGATLLAAQPQAGRGYDAAEPNANDPYEDFGHSHWHNALLWGERVHDIAIRGPGRIYGFGLSRGRGGWTRDQTPEERAAHITPPTVALLHVHPTAAFGYPNAKDSLPDGVGDKAISLRECADVTLRDLTIYHGGHFGILATGDSNLTIENLTIDTNRDGMDIDSCHNVRVSDCTVNTPYDDGICLKSDYALGSNRACEEIAVTNCHVSGFLEGSVIAGTYRRSPKFSPTGRIKLGTESNGGYVNIAISNCTFQYCRGLALEEVDGGPLEDVAITNLTMRDIVNAPIYIRLGRRNRGPEGTPTGDIRRVVISNIVASNVDRRASSMILGLPGRSIEDLTLSNIRILYQGGGTAAQTAINPPELETGYPEPRNHGIMPAYGFYIRHVKGIALHDIDLATETPDARPAIELVDVAGAQLDRIQAEHADGQPPVVLRDVTGFSAHEVAGLPNTAD